MWKLCPLLFGIFLNAFDYNLGNPPKVKAAYILCTLTPILAAKLFCCLSLHYLQVTFLKLFDLKKNNERITNLAYLTYSLHNHFFGWLRRESARGWCVCTF